MAAIARALSHGFSNLDLNSIPLKRSVYFAVSA